MNEDRVNSSTTYAHTFAVSFPLDDEEWIKMTLPVEIIEFLKLTASKKQTSIEIGNMTNWKNSHCIRKSYSVNLLIMIHLIIDFVEALRFACMKKLVPWKMNHTPCIEKLKIDAFPSKFLCHFCEQMSSYSLKLNDQCWWSIFGSRTGSKQKSLIQNDKQ